MNRKVTVDGREIEVSEEIYQSIIESDNPDRYYQSSSKGRILLTNMADEHVKNAYLKKLRELFEEKMSELKSQGFREITKDGTISLQVKDNTLDKLFNEMSRRVENQNRFNDLFTDIFNNPINGLDIRY